MVRTDLSKKDGKNSVLKHLLETIFISSCPGFTTSDALVVVKSINEESDWAIES